MEAGLSRQELANKIKKNGKKINARTIANWEKGPWKPDADSLAKMHEIFKKDLFLFFVPITYKNTMLGESGYSKTVR